MVKKQYILAVVAYLLIPVATVSGGMLFASIDPEIAARTSNYERNYRLLDLAKQFFLLAAFLVNVVLWLLTCFFLLKSKRQSYWWMLAAALGPFGFIAMTMLRDNAGEPSNPHDRFVRGLNRYLRVAYELCVFVAVWILAFALIEVKRELTITYQVASTGVSRAQIIEQQNASSGMWAFGEGLEALYLVVLLYFLWPLGFNLATRVLGSRPPAA